MTFNLLASEIRYRDPVALFALFEHEPYSILLDSAILNERLGRYSFIARDPFQKLTSTMEYVHLRELTMEDNPFEVLHSELERFHIENQPGLPPFQTGIAGYFAYDLCHHLETLPRPQQHGGTFPDLMLGFYDCVIAFDHSEKRAWILSSGFPELDPRSRELRAKTRTVELLAILEAGDASLSPHQAPKSLLPTSSNFTRDEYLAAIQRVIDYIFSGDVFQVNLSQRFETVLENGNSPFNLYRQLSSINPAPFAAYFNSGDHQIVSASPERFLKVQNRRVEARPIKGTRPRGSTPEDDQRLANELGLSEKDRAENVMIVDLLRNDLSRVCQPHSVQVPELCSLESYANVHHLVSAITGVLDAEAGPVDLLRATLPGGSITGAPKIRAMEIIAELEPTARGPYCGNLGYIGFDGNLDLNILIRTFFVSGPKVSFQAGGGIVADSDPETEYLETLHKARPLFAALGSELTHS